MLAARDGVVVRVKEDGDRGGWNKKYGAYGNNIVIQHSDGSRAGYCHLQFKSAIVRVGDTVKKGASNCPEWKEWIHGCAALAFSCMDVRS